MNEIEKLSTLYVSLDLQEANEISKLPEIGKTIVVGNDISDYTLFLNEEQYRKTFHENAKNLHVLMNEKEIEDLFDEQSFQNNRTPVSDMKIPEHSFMIPIDDFVTQCFPHAREDTENLLRNTFWNKVEKNRSKIEGETDRYGIGHSLFMETVNEISEISYVTVFRILFDMYNEEDEEWYDQIREEELSEFTEKYQ